MAAVVTHALADGVWRVPLAPFDLLNTFVFRDADGAVTLVDTGVRGKAAAIAAALRALGSDLTDVQRIVLTHAHNDHAGSAAAVAEQTGAPLLAHRADAGFLRTGTMPPLDRATLVGRYLGGVAGRAGGFARVTVAEELDDQAVLPVAGGLRVVHTPGHTPGHMSLLHEPTGVLITGDAIFNVRRLRWPVRAFCADVALTRRTAHVLGELDYTVAAFTHGPHVSSAAREKVREFLRAAG